MSLTSCEHCGHRWHQSSGGRCPQCNAPPSGPGLLTMLGPEAQKAFFGCVIGGPIVLFFLWCIAAALFSTSGAEKDKIKCPDAGCHTR